MLAGFRRVIWTCLALHSGNKLWLVRHAFAWRFLVFLHWQGLRASLQDRGGAFRPLKTFIYGFQFSLWVFVWFLNFIPIKCLILCIELRTTPSVKKRHIFSCSFGVVLRTSQTITMLLGTVSWGKVTLYWISQLGGIWRSFWLASFWKWILSTRNVRFVWSSVLCLILKFEDYSS